MATVNRKSEPVFMAEHLPDVAAALSGALEAMLSEGSAGFAEGELLTLKASVDSLEIKSRCGCGDDFCASFYTGSLEEKDYGRQRTIAIPAFEGFLYVDVIDGSIRHVEVLYQPDVKAKLDALFD